MHNEQGFDGAKVALLLGRQLVVILRDDIPGLAFAGCWDLPGGGREGSETPFECVSRECEEELGLRLKRTDITWRQGFSTHTGTQWFFVARCVAQAEKQIVLGDEGQCWRYMNVQEYITHPKGIPRLQTRLHIASEEGVL